MGLALVTTTLPARAQDFTTCAAAVSHDYLAAKQQYQTRLRDLIAGKKPEFTPLADLNMQLQTALAEAHHLKLLHLLKSDPARIIAGKGLSQFANFDWTPGDAANLVASDTKFSALTTRIAHLEARNNGHQQWPALRTYVRSDLSSDPDFRQITSQLTDATANLAKRLQTCQAP